MYRRSRATCISRDADDRRDVVGSGQTVDVVVVGGGIAGLTAGYELHRRGVSFRLFESARRFGGVILTEVVDGFTIDAGPDALLVQKPAALDLCGELGLADRLHPTLEPRTAFILRNRVLHPLPEASVLGVPTRFGPFLTTRLFSPAGKLRFGLDLLRRPRKLDPTEDESIASFFTRRFGREAVDYLAEPLLAGIHAGDVQRLSMRALFPRFLEAEAALWQSHPRVSPCRAARVDRRCLPVAAGGNWRALAGARVGAAVRCDPQRRACESD